MKPKVKAVKFWGILNDEGTDLVREEHDNGTPFLFEDKDDCLDACNVNGDVNEKAVLVTLSFPIQRKVKK